MISKAEEKNPAEISYIDFLENALGHRVNSDISTYISDCSANELREFRHRYLELHSAFEAQVPQELYSIEISEEEIRKYIDYLAEIPRVFSCPKRKVGEFRPICHGRILRFADEMFGGDSSYKFDSSEHEPRLNVIKALLLYSHSVVLPDALFYVNQYFQSEQDEYFDKSRRRLANYLSYIATLRPLIEKNIIIMYPQYEHSFTAFPNELFRDQKFEDWFRSMELNSDFDSTVLFIYEDINEIMFFARRYDASALFDNKKAHISLNTMLHYQCKALRIDKAREKKLAEALATTTIPKLSGLSLQDIVEIRQSEEIFDKWRGNLYNAISLIDNNDAIEPNAIIHEIKEIIEAGQKKTLEQINRSSFFKRVKGAIGTFAISGLSNVIVQGSFDPGIVATSASISLLHTYVTGRKRRSSLRALRSHYAIFC